MNDLFATWHHSHPGVLEQLLQARRQLAREPGLEAAWVMVDTAITQVSLWLEEQNGMVSPAVGHADAHRLLRPVPELGLGTGSYAPETGHAIA